MKKHFLSSMLALLATVLLFPSCSEEKLQISQSETFLIYMFVTNDAQEDLVSLSDDYQCSYSVDSLYAFQTFQFDSWEVYMENKMIQSGNEDIAYKTKSVNLHYGPIEQKGILMETNCAIENNIDDLYASNNAEIIVSSSSLFGDEERHIIQLEFQYLAEGVQWLGTRYTVSVDGIPQKVVYPKYWENFQPVSENPYINYPYFILNIDDLKE